MVGEPRPPSTRTSGNKRAYVNRKATDTLLELHPPTPVQSDPEIPAAPAGSVQEQHCSYLRALHRHGVKLPSYSEDHKPAIAVIRGASTLLESTELILQQLREADRRTLDMVLVESAQAFRDALYSSFPVIYAPARAMPRPAVDLTIAEIAQLHGDGACGEVHDGKSPAGDDQPSATRRTTVAEMRAAFADEEQIDTAFLNFLDIGNMVGVGFRPPEIASVDLIERVRFWRARQEQTSFGRSGVGTEHSKYEFMIASTPHVISPGHVDAGGVCTWVRDLKGSKEWYWVCGDREQARLSSLRGTGLRTQFPDGVCGLALQEGDYLWVQR